MLQERGCRDDDDDNPNPYTPLPKDINVEPKNKGWIILIIAIYTCINDYVMARPMVQSPPTFHQWGLLLLQGLLPLHGCYYTHCMGVTTPIAWGLLHPLHGGYYTHCMGVTTSIAGGYYFHRGLLPLHGCYYTHCMGVTTPITWVLLFPQGLTPIAWVLLPPLWVTTYPMGITTSMGYSCCMGVTTSIGGYSHCMGVTTIGGYSHCMGVTTPIVGYSLPHGDYYFHRGYSHCMGVTTSIGGYSHCMGVILPLGVTHREIPLFSLCPAFGMKCPAFCNLNK